MTKEETWLAYISESRYGTLHRVAFDAGWDGAVALMKTALPEQCWKCGDIGAENLSKCEVKNCGAKNYVKKDKPWLSLTNDEVWELIVASCDSVDVVKAAQEMLKVKNT
jgi:hypothetical protein